MCRTLNFLKFLTILTILAYPSQSGLTASQNLNCTINGLTHNYLTIIDDVYDTDDSTTVPYTYSLIAENVSYVDADSGVNVLYKGDNEKLLLVIPKQDETLILSRELEYRFHFTLSLHCNDGSSVTMNTNIRIVDTNNHPPFFSKPKYIYNLISTNTEDFKRLLTLHPIAATDYDITNNELSFSIDQNEYFDIAYGGKVPGTLNKKHFAQLIPKFVTTIINQKIELKITVTDKGYPPRSDYSILVVNPPLPPVPIFSKQFYVGHLYKNYTFKMEEDPTLEEGVTYYKTDATLSCSGDASGQRLGTDGKIIINYSAFSWGKQFFYTRNYHACVITATYTDDLTQLSSEGRATLIVEYHHDL